MSSLQNAVEYPRNNEDEWLRTVAIGGVLTFLSFLLVPLFFVYGYVLRAIRGTLDGENEPPVFDEWGELLIEGVQGWIIGIVYMLVPLVVGSVTVGSAILSVATGSDVGLALTQMFIGFVVTTALALVFGYVAVAAIVNFAREERFGAAFDFALIKDVLTTQSYAVAWLLSVAVFIVAGIITGLLNSIPVIGFFLGSFVTFYAGVVAARLWADGFAEARRSVDATNRSGVEESLA